MKTDYLSVKLSTYFNAMILVMGVMSSFPKKKQMKSRLWSFLIYKVYPIGFFIFWFPLVVFVLVKIILLTINKEWEDLIDGMHIFLLGIHTLYVIFAIQMTTVNFKNIMDKVEKHFVNCKKLTFNELKLVIILWVLANLAFLLNVGGAIYYKGLIVRVWIPGYDDKNLPWPLFLGMWFYQGYAGYAIVSILGFVSPFTIPMTGLVIKELSFLIRKLEQFEFQEVGKGRLRKFQIRFKDNGGHTFVGLHKLKMPRNTIGYEGYMNPVCTTEDETKRFIREFTEYHARIRGVIHEISRIYKFEFITQLIFTITHSCFVAFSMYYSQERTKVLVRGTPLLMSSYYLLFLYCWNGQALTDKCDELFFAIYGCRWLNAPQSFKRSLILLMQFCLRPFQLSGGGLIVASARTFLKGVEQSMSYILLLKEMTPKNIKSN